MLTSDSHTADAIVRSSKTFWLLFFQIVVDCFLPVRSVVLVACTELLDMVVRFWIQRRSLIHDVDLCVARIQNKGAAILYGPRTVRVKLLAFTADHPG